MFTFAVRSVKQLSFQSTPETTERVRYPTVDRLSFYYRPTSQVCGEATPHTRWNIGLPSCVSHTYGNLWTSRQSQPRRRCYISEAGHRAGRVQSFTECALVCVPLPTTTTTTGQRSFADNGPTVWNSLPAAL